MSTFKNLQNKDINHKILFNNEDDAILVEAVKKYELQQKGEENATQHNNMDHINQPKINDNHIQPLENIHNFYEEIDIRNTVHNLYHSEKLEKSYEETLYEDMNQFDIRRTKNMGHTDEEYVHGIKTAKLDIQKHQIVNPKFSIDCIPAKRKNRNELLEIKNPRLFGKCSLPGEEDKKVWNYAENSTITGKVWNYPDNPRIAEKVWNCPDIPKIYETVRN